MALVEIDDGIELPDYACMKIVAESFSFRKVEHTDRAFHTAST